MSHALLRLLVDGRELSDAQVDDLIAALTHPDPSDALKGALLSAWATRGATAGELRALALSMRSRAVQVACPEGAVDTCGTGGDGSSSFNISTAASLVVAAAGVPVVKHGNRAVSGICGSADVLQALGIPLAETADAATAQLQQTGFTFLLAPAFHPATRAIGPIRRALGVRTAFNLIGPLTNPAAPPHQVIGAYDVAAAEQLAQALSGLPIRRAFVVHGEPGWDEATPCGTFHRWEVRQGQVTHTEVDPRFTYGLGRCTPADLAGGDSVHNAALMRAIFAGSGGPLRDSVLLNAALALEVARDLRPREALEAATTAIDNGGAAWLLDRLTHPPPPPPPHPSPHPSPPLGPR